MARALEGISYGETTMAREWRALLVPIEQLWSNHGLTYEATYRAAKRSAYIDTRCIVLYLWHKGLS